MDIGTVPHYPDEFISIAVFVPFWNRSQYITGIEPTLEGAWVKATSIVEQSIETCTIEGVQDLNGDGFKYSIRKEAKT